MFSGRCAFIVFQVFFFFSVFVILNEERGKQLRRDGIFVGDVVVSCQTKPDQSSCNFVRFEL